MATFGGKILKKIWSGLVGTPGTREKYLTTISEGDIKKNKIIKELTKKNKSLEAQISKTIADKRHQKVERQNIFDEIELAKELAEKSEEIKLEQEKAVFNFLPFFKKLITNKKFANSLELCDKDDETVIDNFGTIKVMDNDDIAIYGKSGELWSRGKELSDIIFKPRTLGNQIRRRRILLPFDKNFKFVPDLETYEIPEMSYNPDGKEDEKWNISEERIKPIKIMIQERDEKIHVLRKDKEHLEQVIADLRIRKQDEELAKNSWKAQAQKNQTQLSIALKNEQQAMSMLHQGDRDLTKAKEQKQIAEDSRDVHEEANEKLLEELQDEESQSNRRKTKDEAQYDIQWAKQQVPKEIHQTVIENKEKKEGVKKV